VYDEEQAEIYTDEDFKRNCEVIRKQDAAKSVAKAVITVACIGLICAIIDFYVDEK